MKIDNAILSVDDNDLYASYWPFTSEVWNHFGINPILIHVTADITKSYPHPSKFGTVIQIPLIPNLDSAYQGCIARFLAAAVIHGSNYIFDADMFLCNRKVLDRFESVNDNSIITQTRLETIGISQRLLGGLIAGEGETFKRVYEENGIRLTQDAFWNETILKQIDQVDFGSYGALRHKVGADEILLFQCLANMDDPPPVVVIANPYPLGRTCVTPAIRPGQDLIQWRFGKKDGESSRWTFEGLREGLYWDIHPRKDKDKKVTKRIVDIILGRSD